VEHRAVRSHSPDELERQPPEPDRPLVLIVDDNEKNLRLARDVLRAAGFRTLEATNGVEAIALADEHLPEVILMDIRLPGMDGTEAARKLRGESRTASIPVVALSSLRLDRRDAWLRAAGFAGYLEKPISVREFPDQVRRYCAGAEVDLDGP
jgi:two-component system cell cycle response regulator DivK